MQAKIHPKYYADAKVTCICGNSFTTGSTMPEIQIDICSSCHPFFTGEMKFVDTQGRVDKFQQKVKKADAKYISKKAKRNARKNQTQDDNQPKTLQQMIQTKTTKSDENKKTTENKK